MPASVVSVSVLLMSDALAQMTASLNVGSGRAFTVRLKVAVSAEHAGSWLLVAVMVIAYVPAVVGVPEMVLLLKVSPAGSVEVVTVELVLVTTTSVMALPAQTLWVRLVALKVTVGLTVRLKVTVSGSQVGLLWLLVAVIVIAYVPAAVGAPAMVLLLKVKPSGSSEVVTVELVLVTTTSVMALPAQTLWVRLVALKVTVGFTFRLKVTVSGSQVGLLWLLVAVMVMAYVPAVVGAPEMVLLLKARPSGSSEVVTVELVLVMTTLVMALPAQTLWVRLVALKVTVGLTVSVKVWVLAWHTTGSSWSLVAVMVIV